MDAVVVGGGIVGLASAYELASNDVNVTLLEQSSLGSGSTGRAAGGIRVQFSTPVNVELSLASLPVWESFEDTFGVDIAYRRHGYLLLARSRETATQFEANVELQRELGTDVRFISGDDLDEVCPGLDTTQFEAGTFCETDGFADPSLAVQGYAHACTEGGVDIETGTAVTDVLTSNDGVIVGVATDQGTIPADFVVNAAGPWAARVAALADVDLPISPRRRQILVVEPEHPVPETNPLVIDLDTGSYFRPEREGNAIVGGHFSDADPDVSPDRYDESFDLDWAADAIEHAAAYTEYFGLDAGIVNGWAGLYAVTPDHHAIIEETVPGFITASGFSGHGFQHAPATASIVTSLALSGEYSIDAAAALTSARFETGSPFEERNVA